MGDIADAMLSGLFCEVCGEIMDGEEVGYPRRCEGCDDPAPLDPVSPERRKRNKNKRRKKQRKAAAERRRLEGG
jgi:hypothetical protein